MPVYAIRNTLTGGVKIGRSSCVKARLSGLQSANEAELEILAVVSGGWDREQAYHSFLRGRGELVRGEWFFGPCTELLVDHMKATAKTEADALRETSSEMLRAASAALLEGL